MARRKTPEGIDGLVEKGRAQGFVTYDELNSVLPPNVLTGDQIDDVMEIFGENSIEVVDDYQKVPIPVANLLIGEEAAAEEEEEEAAVEEEPAAEEEFEYPGGIKGNDPVRLYLKEMGAIPLLNREGEVTLAKRIEDGEREIVSSVKSCSIALDELFRVGDKLRNGEIVNVDSPAALPEHEAAPVRFDRNAGRLAPAGDFGRQRERLRREHLLREHPAAQPRAFHLAAIEPVTAQTHAEIRLPRATGVQRGFGVGITPAMRGPGLRVGTAQLAEGRQQARGDLVRILVEMGFAPFGGSV